MWFDGEVLTENLTVYLIREGTLLFGHTAGKLAVFSFSIKAPSPNFSVEDSGLGQSGCSKRPTCPPHCLAIFSLANPNVGYRVLTDNRVLTDLKFY